jgi:hypothetical protein
MSADTAGRSGANRGALHNDDGFYQIGSASFHCTVFMFSIKKKTRPVGRIAAIDQAQTAMIQ